MEKSDQRHFNRLYRNDGNGKFSDVAEAVGVRGEGYGMGVGTADYDNDGLLDLIVINYIRWDIDNEPECKVGNIRAYCSPNSYQGEPNMLRRYAGRGLAIITTAGCWQPDGPQVGAGRLKKGKVSTTAAMALLPTFRNLRASAS